MNEMTAYESALGCKEGSDGATKETEETTNKRNDEVVSGDWVANEGRGNGGGLDGWGCLMVSCTLASNANLTTSYKPVSVHSWCRVKCEVSSRQQTVRGEGYERGGTSLWKKGTLCGRERCVVGVSSSIASGTHNIALFQNLATKA